MIRTNDIYLTERHLQQIEHALEQAREALQLGVTSGPVYQAALQGTNTALRLLEIPEYPLLPAPVAA